jgi:hypothetical protein
MKEREKTNALASERQGKKVSNLWLFCILVLGSIVFGCASTLTVKAYAKHTTTEYSAEISSENFCRTTI